MMKYITKEIPYGFCHCGCGQKTTLAKQTSKEKNWIKGQPKKYLPRHHIGLQFTPAVDRFWSQVEKKDKDSCWLWTGLKNKAGYGSIEVDGSTKRVHRFSWEIHNGSIPSGLLVCHKCDNPACVNPAHLFLGTDADNMLDMINKKRNKRIGKQGKAHHMAKLNEDNVRSIRFLAFQGVPQSTIATRFKVSRATINMIVKGKSWKHVT